MSEAALVHTQGCHIKKRTGTSNASKVS